MAAQPARPSACRAPHRRRADAAYFALTLTTSEDGRLIWEAQTRWAGSSPSRPLWEVREASPVDPAIMTEHWDHLEQPWRAVHDPRELLAWVASGGHALVEVDLARMMLPTIVGPRECAPDGPTGFLTASSLTDAQLRHRPTRGTSKKVRRRDEDCCRRCGRGRRDAQLSQHHVQQHSLGGLSQTNNLVTLCEHCHPEMDRTPDLNVLLPIIYEDQWQRLEARDAQFDAAVQRHRALMPHRLSAARSTPGR